MLLGGVTLSRKSALVFLLLAFVVIATGCNYDEPFHTETIMEEGSFWDKYFVFPLVWALDYFYDFLKSYGWSIVVVTIIIRLLTLPLMMKQLRTSKMMQALQPEMQQIREKFQKDQQRLQQETMKLFQKHNVNPLAGCLPILVQMPILIAFYHAIYRHTEIPRYEFLWFQLGEPSYILAIVAGITTYLQQKMMGVQANPQMKILMVVLPIMITIFAFYFPSALSLYWVIGNLFTIAQTYFMKDMYTNKQEVASK